MAELRCGRLLNETKEIVLRATHLPAMIREKSERNLGMIRNSDNLRAALSQSALPLDLQTGIGTDVSKRGMLFSCQNCIL